jgi:hypothetical protein
MQMSNNAAVLNVVIAAVANADAAHGAARAAREGVYVAIRARRAAIAACDAYDAADADDADDADGAGADDEIVARLEARLADARADVLAAEAACAPLEAAEQTAASAAVTASVGFFALAVADASAAGTRPALRTFDLVTGGHCHRPTHAAHGGVWYTLRGGIYHGRLVVEGDPCALEALGAPSPHALGASWGEYQGGRFCGTVWKRL